MEKELIRLSEIQKSFGTKNGKVMALRGIDLQISEGEFVSIMGKSGSGKSTLLNIIGGMMSPDSGTYFYGSTKIDAASQKVLTSFRRNEVGFIVQYFALVEDMTVYQNVAVPLKFLGLTKKEQKEKILRMLDALEIGDKIDAYPAELSGGQQQRVAIARAVIKKPKLLLADEPTGALDEATGESVMKILKNMNKEGQTIILVTHDSKIAEFSNRIIKMKDGCLV